MTRSGRTVLVTGANRGLGLETCRQLARRGYRVLLTSRDTVAGPAAARALGEHGTVEFRHLDVADRDSIAALAAELAHDGATLDVLVNNAGVAIDGFDARVARTTLDVNFFGALHTTDALLPRMPDGGTIVMVSSAMGQLSCLGPRLRRKFSAAALTREELVELMTTFVRDVEAGRHAVVGWPSSAYAVSKVGLNALTRILARELAPRGFRVNSVCPGWARTDMGGRGATRSVEAGAKSIVWAADAEAAPNGGFFRDGRPIDW